MTTTSDKILEHNKSFIPGGVVSVNRAVEPNLSFVKGEGPRVWDVDGKEYIDYHAAFAPYILGHNDPDVNAVVRRVLDDGTTLMGAGTNELEGRTAELIVNSVPSADRVMLTNTGSEATYHALRIARAHTARTGVVVMQGGYNGWHNDVAMNVMTPLEATGPRVSPGEYPKAPISAGIPPYVLEDVHVVNYNDLDSVRAMLTSHSVSAVLLEPILQNIGIVKPKTGYLEGLRALCDEQGVVLVFDEVKTGFRHALGGFQSICGVTPDLCVFGKALANGFPMGAIGGRSDLMDYFVHEDPAKRVLIAGTYNAHPVACAAAVATMEKLAKNDGACFQQLDERGQQMEDGLSELFSNAGITATIARQGSAFCVYFMDHAPVDWHDIAEHHDFDYDTAYRKRLIENGIYHFPLPTKQGSISLSHTPDVIEETLSKTVLG
ncbi:TPA: aspartate aminotransferase family protein [Candidatus Latescibacteria bacterium]|nr:aspartate aminotransferase family protein [Candidatus Latescibacterota bacterium]